MPNTRLRHATRPVTDPLIDLFDVELPAHFGSAVLRWTPGPLLTNGMNVLPRSSWFTATAGWTLGGTQPPTWAGAGDQLWPGGATLEGCGGFTRASLAANETMVLLDSSTRVPAAAGQWWEYSAYLQGHRCKARLRLMWCDVSGAAISFSEIDLASAPSYPSATKPDEFVFRVLQAQAPAGTFWVRAEIWGIGDPGGSTSPFVLVWRPMLARVSEPSGPPLPYQKASGISGTVSFGGVVYQPVPLALSGFEVTSQGPIPRPRFTLPNIGGFARNLMASYGDLLGAKVTRKRPFLYALDNMEAPDPSDFYGPDVWLVDRVVLAAPELIEFELCSPLDIQGKMLPALQVIRDVCTHSYRTWNSLTSQFTPGTCPYAGGAMFEANGNSTADPTKDACGRRLVDCISRFGPDADLPTRAFPGIVTNQR